MNEVYTPWTTASLLGSPGSFPLHLARMRPNLPLLHPHLPQISLEEPFLYLAGRQSSFVESFRPIAKSLRGSYAGGPKASDSVSGRGRSGREFLGDGAVGGGICKPRGDSTIVGSEMAGKPSSIKGQKRKQVLSDHKKVGKKLIPPLYQHIPSLHETWFRNDGVPEIIWIAALLKDLGTRSGIEVVEELTDIPLTQQITPNLAVASGYYDLPEEVMRDLQNSKVLQRADVTAVLRKLSRLFPEFPMKFMTPTEEQETIEGVQWLRATMEPLYIKTSKPMVLALATSVHIALATGKLRVCFEGSKLDRMNALSEYPDSEESRAVAAVVRSSFHILYGPEPESHGQWARAFWNRCWELGNCDGKA